MNKLILLVVFAGLIFTTGAPAQKKPPRPVVVVQADEPPPPPPRALASVPAELTRGDVFANGEFVSGTGGFRVAVPVKPLVRISEMNAGFGKSRMMMYQATTTLGSFGVNYFDFPAPIKDETELRLRMTGVREATVKSLNGRLLDEKDIYFGTNFGREFSVETGSFTVTQRVLVVEQRFFQLIAVTPGLMSKSMPRAKAANRARIDKFLNSFAVTKLPAPAAETPKLPADFGVKIENSKFSSSFFGMTIDLPAGWNVLKKDEGALVMDLGMQSLGNSPKIKPEEVELSYKNTVILMMATKQPIDTGLADAALTIGAEVISFPNFLPEVVTKNYEKNFLEKGKKVTHPTSMTKFGGVDFAWTELTDTKTGVSQRLYVANRNRIALEISVVYKNEADLRTLLNSLESLKFDEKR